MLFGDEPLRSLTMGLNGSGRRFAKFQTDHHINFVMDYCQGGELYELLLQQPKRRFNEPAVGTTLC